MVDFNNHPVVLVMSIAVIAPLLAEIPIGFRLPTVMLEMVFGIVVGPQVLGLVRGGGLLGWLGTTLGLGALFFFAGLELDLRRVRGRPLSLAARGWLLSLALGLATAWFLSMLSLINSPLMVAMALTTTAMGTILPILRDGGELESDFGTFVLAAGAMGEFGPIVMVSLLLTPEHGSWLQVGGMLGLVAITFLAALAVLSVKSPKILDLLNRTMHSSTQLPVRLAVLLITFLFVLSEILGIEAVLGAFAAGMIFRVATRGEGSRLIYEKMDAVCFGFFVPFFFVTSGINFDLGALLQSARAMLLIPIFLILLLVVRGAPVFLYRRHLAKGERLSLALYTATALPMVVAITHIGVQVGRMQSDIAAALVGAAMLSVLLFPAIAGSLQAKRALVTSPVDTK